MGTRPVVIVAFEGMQSLDLCGPLEVFAGAGRFVAGGAYDVRLATAGGAPVASWSGLRVHADADLHRLRGPVDTLLVAGGEGVAAAAGDAELVRHVRRLARRARRVASVCTGAFVLAQAGLLDGRRATTHWASCDRLGRLFPEVRVEREPIYVQDGPVWTSAGVTAGIDLALAMVREDHGRDVALAVARQLVVFLHRPGGQAQFSAQLAAQFAERDVIRGLQGWIADNPAADLTVEALAERVAMSPRNFARVFAEEVGVTPARYVERVRVEHARRRLEETAEPVDLVARECGFRSAETMRRALQRSLGVAPTDYRRRFRVAAPA